MTISRERTGLVVTEATSASFASASARRGAGCPWIVLGNADETATSLHLLAEPLEATPRSMSVGGSILAAIREVFHGSAHPDPLMALTEALDAANHALYQQNRAVTPGERVVLGLTALVIREQELLICQVPPTQLILSQGGIPIMLPALSSWRADYQPQVSTDQQGLGAGVSVAPAFFRANLEAGDQITLCSSGLARRLAVDDSDAFLAPLLGTSPEEARDFLADLADRDGVEPAYAAVIAPLPDDTAPAAFYGMTGEAGADDDDAADADMGSESSGHRGGWLERGLREMRERSRIIPWPGGGRRTREQGGRLRVVDDAGDPGDDREERVAGRPLARFPGARAAGAAPPAWEDQGQHDGWGDDAPELADDWDDPEGYGQQTSRYHAAEDARDADGYGAERTWGESPRPRRRRVGPGQVFSSAVALVVLVVGTLLERVLPPRGRREREGYLDRSRSRMWPLGSLERWNRRGRRRMSYLPLFILAGIVVVGVVVMLSIRNHQIQAERQRFDAALARIGRTREVAVASPDRAAAHNQLLALPAALAAIPAADKPGRPERIAEERAAVLAAIDRVDGIERLPASAIQLLAPLPSPVGQAAPTPRTQLVVGAGQQYLLINGTVYTVDARARTTTRLLGRGDSAGGTTVGPIIGIAWKLESLVVLTETQALTRDKAGAWSASPLAATGRKPAATDSFDGNLYFLEPERGQIVKYAAGAFTQSPQPWSTSKSTPDLNLAADMAIDKGIDILLSDGRILDFYQGEVKATFAPSVVPPLAGASALAVAPDGKWLYVIDPREGRLVRLGRDGGVAGVFKPADGARSFSGVRDVAVDEAAGLVYLLTDEAVLSVRLP